MDLIDELLGLVDALNAKGIAYAVCGGIALAIHGHPRFTQDIDLLVQPPDREALRSAARGCGFTLEGLPLHFGAGTANEREILRMTKVKGSEALTLELLLVGPSLIRVWETGERIEWRGRQLVAVSREGLVEMKRVAGRAQDLLDIDVLRTGKEERGG